MTRTVPGRGSGAGRLPTQAEPGAPGAPALVPPARRKTALVSAAGILPLLEAVSYLLSPRLAGLAVRARPPISVVIVIPLMRYAVMPVLTRAARPVLYPARASRALRGAS